MCLYLNSFLSCSIATKRFTKVSYLLYWTPQPQGLSSLPRAAVVAGCKIFFKISNSNVLEFYLFINARMVWRTAKTCVANYNWWWVYYQNIVTRTCDYLSIRGPFVVLYCHCSNPLQLVDCVEWGLLLYGLVISTAVGSSPAHGPARLVPVCMVIYYCTIVRRSEELSFFPCGSCRTWTFKYS